MHRRRFVLALLLLAGLGKAPPAPAAEEDFAGWLAGLRQDALAQGIRPATLDRALAGLEPLPRVIELDRQQPESVVSYADYLRRVVSPERIQAARQHLAQNRALLDEVARRYGVQPRFIVALWGIETTFGEASGKFPVIASLATLAYDGRRGAFFRKELINALRIVEQDNVDPKEMLGSWAGAMGQSQFMPSSFLLYAVSYSGDGRRDIWHRRADVFASIANYLAQLGWRQDESWGRVVTLPARLDPALIGPGIKKPLTEWRKLGLRRADGGKLPEAPIEASLLQPGAPDGPAVLVYDNYRVLMKWNSSNYFATAVGLLADGMGQR
ncbi:MAG: lytic transglycosylase domain-containing protein [Stellaceae bacterium]